MTRISFPKLALVLALAALLTTPAGWSAGRRFSTDDSPARIFTSGNPLVAFWSYLASFWEKEGCGIDPDGSCAPAPASPDSNSQDAGCGLDPSGCVTSSSEPNPKNGCGIDPHGGNCT